MKQKTILVITHALENRLANYKQALKAAERGANMGQYTPSYIKEKIKELEEAIADFDAHVVQI